MKQYIDKSSVVAEIEKRISEVEQIDKASYEVGLLDAYKIILSFLNTLEVKDVDLEKEIDNVWSPHFNLGWDDNSLVSINHKSFEAIAKHFFELGLKTLKGE